LRSSSSHESASIDLPWIPAVAAYAIASEEKLRGEIMLSTMTRTRVIQVWLAAVALVIVAAGAFGAGVRVGTGGLLLALSLVPPLIVFLLWPKAGSLTAGDVIRGTEPRN
jgi:hypothetical protein